MAIGPLIVVSGPSGSGKTTLVDRVLALEGARLRRSITATTRIPRAGEIDGVHYHFWTVERFDRARGSGEMLEWAVVHGRDYYGTPRSEVDRFRREGTGVILVIDVQGADQVRKTCPEAFTIFLYASPGECERRLRNRGSDTEDQIRNRMATAERELARAGEFHEVLTNDDLERAVGRFRSIVQILFDRTTGS